MLEITAAQTLIARITGIGEGLLNWLASALGETAVTASPVVTRFKFTRRSKAQLGVDFLALVETNRFKYWAEETEFDDAWWYFAQANHYTYALDPGRPLETHLRWFVPATTKRSPPPPVLCLSTTTASSAPPSSPKPTNSSATAVSS